MRYFLLATVAVAALSASIAVPARAQDDKALSDVRTKIAVVDVQKVIGTSKAGKSIQDQIAKEREVFTAELSKLEKELSGMQKSFMEQKDMKPEDAAVKKKEFETRQMEANKLAVSRRQAIEKAAAEGIIELRKQIVKTVAGISEKEGFDLVLASQNVIVSQNQMDVTDAVLKQVDKDLPDVKLNFNAAAPAESGKGKKK